MMTSENMQRVGKQNPCPICGKSDWCLVAPDKSAAICQRMEDGSVKRCGDAGYLHILIDRHRSHRNRSRRKFIVIRSNNPDKDFAALQQQYNRQITNQQIHDLSQQLGLSTQSLKRLRIGWDSKAYTFPMSNSQGRIIGIRRRFPSGRKVSVIGSKNGLFVPTERQGGRPLLIVEGETDLAAALDLAFDAIGRPNCNSKIEMTAKAASGRSEIIIVGDNDAVGRAGAEKLGDALAIHYPSVKIIYPPDGIKDLRQWLKFWLRAASLQQIIRDTKPVEVAISFKD